MRGLRLRRAQGNDEARGTAAIGISGAEHDAPGQPGRRPSRRSLLLIAGCVGLVAVLAAAAVLVPAALPRGAQPSSSASSTIPAGQSSGSPIAQTTRSPETSASATDSPAPSATGSPVPSPKPIVASGWPVTWQPDANGHRNLTFGSDATVYLSFYPSESEPYGAGNAIAVDASGHQRTGWLHLPDGRTLAPAAYGSDGTIYVVEDGKPGSVYAFDRDGSLRHGWPIATTGRILPGPAGTLYLEGGGKLIVVGADGTVKATGDEAWGDLCGLLDAVIRPDGTLFTLSCTDASYRNRQIAVFGPNGQKLAGPSTALWDEIAMGSDGTLVAWKYDTVGADVNVQARDIHLAVIGTDGKPAAGWPQTFQGAASAPVVGSDGTVYLNLLPSGSQPSQVMALRSNGQPKAGWPITLATGTRHVLDRDYGQAFVPVSPVLGRDGAIYVVTENGTQVESVIAFDSAGHVKPGWPAVLPARIAALGAGVCTDICPAFQVPLFVVSPSGHGLLYVHLANRILALTEDGKLASGWPKELAASDSPLDGWSSWAATPDGGLVTLEERQQDGSYAYVLTRWNADGSVAS